MVSPSTVLSLQADYTKDTIPLEDFPVAPKEGDEFLVALKRVPWRLAMMQAQVLQPPYNIVKR